VSVTTQVTTILLSDLQGYTERQSRSSRDQIAQDLALHESLLAPVFFAFHGRIVKTMGDAFLVAFASATDAVLAAAQVQKRLAVHNEELVNQLHALRVRIGIATGEVTFDTRGDVFGEPVNLASRMQTTAEPGAVWLSEATFLAMNKTEVQALEVGRRVFKGIPGEVKVYRILDAFIAGMRLLSPEELTRAGAAAGAPGARAKSMRRWIAIAAAIHLLAFAIALVLWQRDGRPPLERFESNPTDLASADAWLETVRATVYEAERTGTQQALYREGKIEAKLLEHAPRLAARASFRRTRAIWLMANEPLGPGAPEVVLQAVQADAGLRSDAQFCKLLDATVEYARKDPAAFATYTRAANLLQGK